MLFRFDFARGHIGALLFVFARLENQSINALPSKWLNHATESPAKTAVQNEIGGAGFAPTVIHGGQGFMFGRNVA